MTRFASFFLFLTSFAPHGLAQTQPPDYLLDHNGDGVIDSKDLLILIRRWGLEGIATPTPTLTPTSTPTPTATSSQTPIPPPTDTFSPTPSPSATETPTPTPTLTGTSTHTSTPTSTETPTITDTAFPTETPTDPGSSTVDLPEPPTPLPLRMVRIPAGSFLMGSPETERNRSVNEGPLHEVTIAYDFYLSETEVTQAHWEAVMGGEPRDGNDYPVSVTWEDAQAFLAGLNALGQGTFRLPSEAEWEYACRAGSTTRFFFGDSLGCADDCENCDAAKQIFVDQRADYMWYCGSSGDVIHPVRQLLPNFFGLYDMAGSFNEWCQDTYRADYAGVPNDGSAWESGDQYFRSLRGGNLVSGARYCRSAYRGGADTYEDHAGFRLARDP